MPRIGSSKAPAKNRREMAKQAEAFSYYASLGKERTYKKVAEKVLVSESSVNQWAAAFDWQARVQDHDQSVSRKTLDSIEIDQVAHQKELYVQTRNWLIRAFRVMGRMSDTEFKRTLAMMPKMLSLDMEITGLKQKTVFNNSLNVTMSNKEVAGEVNKLPPDRREKLLAVIEDITN